MKQETQSSPEIETCECVSWCHPGSMMLLSHHPQCAKYNPVKDAHEIITGLLRGIESAAADTDGIHPDLWDAYKLAKTSVREFNWSDMVAK